MIHYLLSTGANLFYQDRNRMPISLAVTELCPEETLIRISLSPVQLDFLGKHQNGEELYSVEPFVRGWGEKAPFVVTGSGRIEGHTLTLTVESVSGPNPECLRNRDTDPENGLNGPFKPYARPA